MRWNLTIRLSESGHSRGTAQLISHDPSHGRSASASPEASDTQAASVATAAKIEFLKDGDLVTTTLVTGQHWDAPNGWAPLQRIAVAGLRQYRKTQLAETIACRWVLTVNRVYRESGRLVEKV
jgi:alpha,alpha-trehalase